MKRKCSITYIIVCCLLLLRSIVQAQVFYPGASVALAKDNKVIHTKGHGTGSLVTQLLFNEHRGFHKQEEVVHHLRFYSPQPVQPS